MKIYARMDEEGGLDWGHEIHAPGGKSPEELGYKQFDSVEAAREYYGLTQEEELLTETE